MRTEEMLLNVGPQHPSTHGVFRLVLRIDGEMIKEATPVIGYLHRGTEKLAEDLTYTQIIPYTDRMDYVNAMNNNHALVHAVEMLMDIEVPERAEYLRIIVNELNRVASHLVWFGTYLLDIGAMSPFLYAFRDREKIVDLFNELCGARLTYNYMRVGGVKWDAPVGWIKKVSDLVKELRLKHKEYMDLAGGNEIFLSRVKGIGQYDRNTAICFGLSGPCLRCTGVPRDLRKDEPYSIYNRFDFQVPVATEGDCRSRFDLRMEEIKESLSIVEQAVDSFPESGPIMAKVPRVLRPPEGEVYAAVENPRGELGVHVISKGKDKPWRIHWKRPSFSNLQILPHLLKGENVSNLIAILGAVDIVLGDVDA
ncbi:NADH-quinone oxidoreductase subunit D [Marininema mesophilum]|uniref:NADH-quinone oxidoreductase subunit D n=1 Tax=Marininema mesophilum TaxID=1048340 RepID=A0A1H2R105_9BACL|nr:NADH-quinone oxidoreductase subunit D [Marininema mesophilum]SDW13061.1 NADH-quinone oxidoreductase subunit D [Marininema mesophilum]